MNAKDGAKKTVKLLAVDMPSNVLGLPSLKRNHKHIKDMYQTITLPHCPFCATGVLEHNEGEEWQCHVCSGVVPGKTKDDVLSYIRKIQQQQYEDVGITEEQRTHGIKNHTWYARIFFVFAALCVIYFLYGLASGESLLVTFARFFIGLAFFVNALKNAFRAYQFINDRFYIQGEFVAWFKRVQWWV